MLNKIISVEVSGQNLIVQEKLSSVRATVGLIEVAFTFDSYWDNFIVKKAHFQNSNDTNAFTEDIINGKCEIPPEALFYSGVISVAVEGTNINGQVERTNTVDIIKQTETIIKGRNCINPTPDQYTQFIKTVDERIQERVSSKADNLDIAGETLQLKSGDDILSTVAIPTEGSYNAIVDETGIADIISAFENGKKITAYVDEGSTHAFLPLTEVHLEGDKYIFYFTESTIYDAPDDAKSVVINVVKCYEEDGETVWDVDNTPVAPVNYCYYNILGVPDTPFDDVVRYISSDSVIKLTFTTDYDEEVTIRNPSIVIDSYDRIQFNAIVGTDLYIITCTSNGWEHYVVQLRPPK